MNISSSLKLNSKFNIKTEGNGLILDLDILKIKLKKNYAYKIKSNIGNNGIELFEQSLMDLGVQNDLAKPLHEQITFSKKINESKSLFNFKAFLFFMFKYIKEYSFAEDVINEFNSKNIDLIMKPFKLQERSKDSPININSRNPIIKLLNNFVVSPENDEIIIQYIIRDMAGKLSKEHLPSEFLIKKLYIYYPSDLFKR